MVFSKERFDRQVDEDLDHLESGLESLKDHIDRQVDPNLDTLRDDVKELTDLAIVLARAILNTHGRILALNAAATALLSDEHKQKALTSLDNPEWVEFATEDMNKEVRQGYLKAIKEVSSE